MRFAYFHIKLRLGGYQLQINDEEQPINKRYDAFVVYNQHDSDWVIHELIPHLENIDPPNNYKLCIHERDFLPGNDIFENILDSIEQSKKTMLILSPGFAASEWCYFEMRMAQSCLFEEKRDIIVMVSLKKIPDDDMPRILRNILLTKSYLEWPENGMGRRLFWEKLKVALRSDSRVNRVAAL
ncbi:toll-like receptor 2 type-2 [Ptychodera flava]|uniref:toll-like receptor 2 type-2 n=1 Tax=Ptychodera flava TaxID=63121 RepID=UPI00396AB13D